MQEKRRSSIWMMWVCLVVLMLGCFGTCQASAQEETEVFTFRDPISWGMSLRDVMRVEEEVLHNRYDSYKAIAPYEAVSYSGKYYDQDANMWFFFSDGKLEQIFISYYRSANHDVIKRKMFIDHGPGSISSMDDMIAYTRRAAAANGNTQEAELQIEYWLSCSEEEQAQIVASLQVWELSDTTILYVNNGGYAEVYYTHIAD